jgi:hypothetical protein
MRWHKRFRSNCSPLQVASFGGVSFGIPEGNNPKGTRASIFRDSVAEQSNPALRPERISDA